jgi:hypothetical protein
MRYPDWLIQRVIDAASTGDVESAEEVAAAVLDALGFEQHIDHGILLGGLLHHSFPISAEVGTYSKWVARTEWRRAE